DGGSESSVSTDADFWWEQNTSVIRTFVPNNGAKFFVLPSAACLNILNPLKAYTAAIISSYPLSTSSFHASDNVNNKIPTGTKVMYQTNEGRYGIFEVAQYGYNLTLNYVTYNATGSIYSQGCGIVIRGTYLGDLDGGNESSSETDADFWWEQNTSVIRT